MPRIVLKDLDTERVQEVPESEASLGRDPACAILIAGPKSRVVSARHVRIFLQDGAWWIQDTSRNGTVLDNERLQAGQRHALKVGQVIGLGESGPRLKVLALETRRVAGTVVEAPPQASPRAAARANNATTPSPDAGDAPATPRRPGMERPGVKPEEPTEPNRPAADWIVHVVIRGTNTNARFDVRGVAVRLGRSPECDVQVPPELGASVSRTHAEITIHDGGVVIRDAGSRNGTFVNGKRLEAPQPAATSDLIMLGSGGPTFVVEELHIVKGQTAPLTGTSGISSQPIDDITPVESPGSAAPRRKPFREPPTAPSPHEMRSAAAVGAAALAMRDDRRRRAAIWTGVVIVAAALLALAFT